jgi:hypothetical protein
MYMPHPLKARSTHPFELPDPDTLVLYDPWRRKIIFQRCAGESLDDVTGNAATC